MDRVKLVVVGGDLENTEIDLQPPTVFGRGRGVDVILTHPLVSRRHCEISEKNGQLCVTDLGSVNGTFIGDRQISEAPLHHGDLLTVGTVTYRAVFHSKSVDETFDIESSGTYASFRTDRKQSLGPDSTNRSGNHVTSVTR